MQLTVDAESTIDLQTKMSLSEENLEKCVSDVLSDVKNDGIPNGDVTNGNEVAIELKQNTDIDTIGQLKESVQIKSVSTVNTETPVCNSTEIHGINVDIQTSPDCETTGILNGDKEIATNSEPVDESKDSNDSTKNENNTLKENITNSEPVDQSQNIIGSIEKENTTVETNITNSEVIDELHSIIDSIEKENTTVEKNNSNYERRTVETVLKQDGLPENNLNEELGESENAVTKPITDCNNIEPELTTLQVNDKSSVDVTEVRDTAISPCIDINVNSSECVNINEESDETEISDSKQTNFSDNRDVIKEVIKKTEDKYTGSDSSPAIKEGKEELHDDITQSPERSNKETKIEMMTREIEENVPVSEVQESMETDKPEIDTSAENVDLIRLNDSEICDVPADSGNHEARTEKLSATDSEEKDKPNIDNVTEMDVDESLNNSNEQDTKGLQVTPTENTPGSTESQELIETDEAKTVSTLDHSLNISDDSIVNLDNDKDKTTVNTDKSESNQIIQDDDKPVIDCDDDTDVMENKDKLEAAKSIVEIIDLDENVPKEARDSKSSSEENKKLQGKNKDSLESKTMEPVLKLSNTLDILSDDEEEQPKIPPNDSKCINIEDDDDVMLIDDDITSEEKKSEPVTERDVEKESKPASTLESKTTEDSKTPDQIDKDHDKDTTVPEKEVGEPTSTPDISEKVEETKLETETQKPLIPENFLKTCKKNLEDMTREELEEFCILKIVESVLDRSNLSEIKSKLKMLTQHIEDYKKKALMLSKQNRDLQVVLKSIQDDVKKNNEAPIVPLKITRSVGMQVLMGDKPEKRRRTGIGMPNTNKQLRTPAMQSPRPQKPLTPQIPVPRLVPANNTAIKSPNAQPVNAGKVTSPLPNGVKTVSPAQKVEKRPHNRMQSVTVDLTDDEPPQKVVNRTPNPVPPVRLVPSQNLLAAPRTPTVNSPRKVYIPISGPQAQNVRPGQTIMLKTVPSSGQRQRVPPPHMVRMPQTLRMARPQGLRHPAPLPECMKQYQPPNWKALPPAPDLKLAKVENGIVISWKIEGYQEDSYEEIASYQLYAYQETTSPPNTSLWKKIGDVKALPLPMACTLTQFMAGYKYYFAVRAVDIRSRLGPFSLPGSILLLNKM